MDFVIVLMLAVIIAILLHINHKLPPRDYVKEAKERDRHANGE
jgi:hypothetical protein